MGSKTAEEARLGFIGADIIFYSSLVLVFIGYITAAAISTKVGIILGLLMFVGFFVCVLYPRTA